MRRADRSVSVALALAVLFVAGASAVVPSAETARAKPQVTQIATPPLPVNLAPEQPVEAIVNRRRWLCIRLP